MLLYYPCFECLNKYNRQYSPECIEQCDYAQNVQAKKKLEAEKYHLEKTLKEHRICPECGEHMSFYIEGNFGGSLGVFNCTCEDCEYEDRSVDNMIYATDDELKKFYEDTKDIMW